MHNHKRLQNVVSKAIIYIYLSLCLKWKYLDENGDLIKDSNRITDTRYAKLSSIFVAIYRLNKKNLHLMYLSTETRHAQQHFGINLN